MARKTRIPARRGSVNRDWQAREYAQNMRVKHGELVWDSDAHPDRFGARGDFVTVEEYHAKHPLPVLQLAA